MAFRTKMYAAQHCVCLSERSAPCVCFIRHMVHCVVSNSSTDFVLAVSFISQSVLFRRATSSMLLPKCQRCEQAVHPERYGRGTHCCGRCADTKLFEEVTHGQHCMHQRWEEGLCWDPGMKRFFIEAEITGHNVPTRRTTLTQRTKLMCHACVEDRDNYGPCRCLCRACPDVDDVPSHDVCTDGEWSDPGPPLNVNLLTAEGQVVVEALAQLREPDNTRGLVWIPDYQARFAGLGMTLRELLDSHQDKFRVDHDWWIMSPSYELPYVDHVSVVTRCI